MKISTEISHPCFSSEAACRSARLHLPVAPECNIQCTYCKRKYDCVNESRPGVASSIISPEEALERVKLVENKFPNLKVIGIAGPGDTLANPNEVFKTFRLIRDYNDKLKFCFSTNGVNVVKHLKEIRETGVKYITVTINSRKVDVARTFYRWAKDGDTFHKGALAAHYILEKQEEALAALKEENIHLKVNSIFIPGVNDNEMKDLAEFAKNYGAEIHNIMPFIPTKGTYFENFPMASRKTLIHLQKEMSSILPQMTHCRQCRADAVGNVIDEKPIFIENGKIEEICVCGNNKNDQSANENKIKRFAVASKNGYLVDQHFGHANEFLIYDASAEGIKFVERRKMGQYCYGQENCETTDQKINKITGLLSDCNGLLALRIGDAPRKALEDKGIHVNMTCNRIEDAIRENCLYL
ncbi:MAG: radical SAM protein [bacterium]